MAKNVEVAVVGQNLETAVTNAVPLIQNFLDLEGPGPRRVSKREPEGPLIGLVS
jgi:hypothetical protein